jgi:hypothetical protein
MPLPAGGSSGLRMAIGFVESNVGYTSTAAHWVQACLGDTP